MPQPVRVVIETRRLVEGDDWFRAEVVEGPDFVIGDRDEAGTAEDAYRSLKHWTKNRHASCTFDFLHAPL